MSDAVPPASAAREMTATCCVVGGGPAGMMLGYLLARAGVETVVLEKHADFLRDFRGDTVHPSTMQIMHELGLLEDFLKRPHQRIDRIGGDFGGQMLQIADFRRLDVQAPFIAMMPQWDFLDFLADQAETLPAFKLLRRTQAHDLLRAGETITGVAARDDEGELRIGADVTIACDGRHSVLRARAGLQVEDIGAPIDVLWFRIAKSNETIPPAFAHAEADGFLVTIDRGDYWQCAFVIPKDAIAAVQAKGIAAFRARIVQLVPQLRAHIDDVGSWDDVKLLTVTIDRLTQWARPGLLCIGDAAHAMSPVGGVGINLAIQDAVAAANALAAKLRQGAVTLEDLQSVQRRRLFPVKVIQALQVQAQNRIINPALQGGFKPPWPLRLVSALPVLQGYVARLLAVGVRPEHVQSPKAG